MAATASISVAELQYIAGQVYVGKTFAVALINAPGTTFAPTDSLSTVTANEVGSVGGYARQTFTYATGDVLGFSTNGIPLARKAAVFTHSGSTPYTFSHVAIIRTGSSPSVVGVTALVAPTTLADGNQAVFYIDATTWRVTG